ncbi:unnamed protein product [Adineta steineri]|uniref:MULE transposase domain-containing protein n=1 Tax=Adineta steineri TaxID=433720 RepID=A0A815Y0J0_9BILA|nr:unnamed protein product [Adineta steineri]CAF1666019.1 unnamed protein product [Adineta steineri]
MTSYMIFNLILASAFYKKRSRRYPGHPRTQDFEIPEFYGTNNRGENFVFPNIDVKCCWYHFVQALWRKIQKIGLTSSYETDPLVNTWLKQFMALPLILKGLINDSLQILKDTVPSNDTKYIKFLKYFEKEYINRTSVELWHHGNNDMKTNNSLEESIDLKEYLKSASFMVGKIRGQNITAINADQTVQDGYLLDDKDEDD